jgi:hypothetical protein
MSCSVRYVGIDAAQCADKGCCWQPDTVSTASLHTAAPTAGLTSQRAAIGTTCKAWI